MAMQVQKFEKKFNAEKKRLEMLEDYKQNLKKLEEKSLLEKKSSFELAKRKASVKNSKSRKGKFF